MQWHFFTTPVDRPGTVAFRWCWKCDDGKLCEHAFDTFNECRDDAITHGMPRDANYNITPISSGSDVHGRLQDAENPCNREPSGGNSSDAAA
jgi:hypothetical protein